MNTLNHFSTFILLAVFGLLFSCSGEWYANKAIKKGVSISQFQELASGGEESTDDGEGWVVLFDGTSTEGWRGYGKEAIPSRWKIVDGALHMQGSGRGEAGAEDGGDIIYDKQFENFHLKLRWKIGEGGNSGIFYLGQETPDYDAIWQTAPEMQVLDNERHPDAMLGKDGNRQAGSLYDLIPAKPQNTRPAGEWNDVEIIVFKGTVIHKQNGVVVVEYHLWTPEWDEMIAGSKFPSYNENWAKVAPKGYIGLQDHGDDVWFKDIKIKEL
jgi:hypothetical protein